MGVESDNGGWSGRPRECELMERESIITPGFKHGGLVELMWEKNGRMASSANSSRKWVFSIKSLYGRVRHIIPDLAEKDWLLSGKFSEPSTGTRVSMRVTEKRMCGMWVRREQRSIKSFWFSSGGSSPPSRELREKHKAIFWAISLHPWVLSSSTAKLSSQNPSDLSLEKRWIQSVGPREAYWVPEPIKTAGEVCSAAPSLCDTVFFVMPTLL